jgi:hypothetical protein
MPSSEQIRESIEARLTELRSEKTSLEAARAALHTNGASRAQSRPTGAAARTPTRRRASIPASKARATATATATATQTDPPPQPTPAPATSEPPAKTAVRSRKPRVPTERRRTTRREPVAVLLAGKLEAMLRDAEDGLNAVEIAKQASARDAQVRGLLRELESAGRVRRSGTGRASRWKLITDEERIAERAAELAALSTPKH